MVCGHYGLTGLHAVSLAEEEPGLGDVSVIVRPRLMEAKFVPETIFRPRIATPNNVHRTVVGQIGLLGLPVIGVAGVGNNPEHVFVTAHHLLITESFVMELTGKPVFVKISLVQLTVDGQIGLIPLVVYHVDKESKIEQEPVRIHPLLVGVLTVPGLTEKVIWTATLDLAHSHRRHHQSPLQLQLQILTLP